MVSRAGRRCGSCPDSSAQYGGWSRRPGGVEIANIVAFWADSDSYESLPSADGSQQ
ncbi:hypothetical protein [Saccharopolyspora shandongensis]|uniref:hypothetical protein n=1 Tax=Saccharopolyspora shandongensis TaxID=418495 RepID=UPI003F4DB45D